MFSLVRQCVIWIVLTYLRLAARGAVALSDAVVIGVAGSLGKSSTRNALEAMLKDQGSTRVVSGNSETGIPLGLLGIRVRGFTVLDWIIMLAQVPFHLFALRGVRYLIVEMGTDGMHPPKNMSYLLRIVRPHIAVWLNVAPTHMMQFGEGITGEIRMEDVVDGALQRMSVEDGKIITASGCHTAIYNADDARIVATISNHPSPYTEMSYGRDVSNRLFFTNYRITPSATLFEYMLREGDDVMKLQLVLQQLILPREYREVLAAAILVGVSLGLSRSTIIEQLERNFHLPKGRSQLLSGVNNSLIIDSSYNSSPDAVAAFLALARELRVQTGRPLVFLFGDMNELGATAEYEHRKIADELSDMNAVYCVGPQTQETVMPLLHDMVKAHTGRIREAQWFPSAWELGEYLQTHLPHHALVLAKGSQNRVFLEEGVKALLANPVDSSRLCRQERYWLNIKKQGHFLAK